MMIFARRSGRCAQTYQLIGFAMSRVHSVLPPTVQPEGMVQHITGTWVRCSTRKKRPPRANESGHANAATAARAAKNFPKRIVVISFDFGFGDALI